jgi:hypothetical protein
MKSGKHFVIMIAFVALLSFPTYAQSIKTKTASGVDLTTFETFTVMKGEVMTPRDQQKIDENALFNSVKVAVRKELELRGYTFVEDSSAQLYVSYVAGVYDLTEGGNMGPLSQTPASNPSEMNQSRTWSRETREGMMVVDITNSSGQNEVWSASGRLTLDGVDLTRALDAAIYRAFKKFPNKNKKKKKKQK